ncbi:MAG: hypothetical protein OHK0045_22820 [Raineya sp.]
MFFQPEHIERGIFECIRRKAIDFGYWVDESVLSTSKDLEEAISNLETSIEVVGVGDYIARGEKPKNCLVVDFDGGTSGEIGGIGRVIYTRKNSNSYDKVALPSQSEHINFNVVLIAENTFHRRIAEKIIRASLPQKAYIFGISENGTLTDNGFWVFAKGFVDVSRGGEYGIERRFSYVIDNVFLEQPTITEVAAFKEFDLDLNPKK